MSDEKKTLGERWHERVKEAQLILAAHNINKPTMPVIPVSRTASRIRERASGIRERLSERRKRGDMK